MSTKEIDGENVVVLVSDDDENETPRASSASRGKDTVLVLQYTGVNIKVANVFDRALTKWCVNGKFLDDSLIRFWFARTEKEIWKGVWKNERFFLDTNTYSEYVSSSPIDPVRYLSSEKRWKKGLRVFSGKWIFVPINTKRHHWSLVVLQVEKGKTSIVVKATHLDSCAGCHNTKMILKHLNEYFTKCVKKINAMCDHHGKHDERLPETIVMLRKDAMNVPQQHNGCDCGVFVCEFVTHFDETTFEAGVIDLNRMFPPDHERYIANGWRSDTKQLIRTLAEEQQQEEKHESQTQSNVDEGDEIEEVRPTTKMDMELMSDKLKQLDVVSNDRLVGKMTTSEIQKGLQSKFKNPAPLLCDLLQIRAETSNAFTTQMNQALTKHYASKKSLDFFFQVSVVKTIPMSQGATTKHGPKIVYKCKTKIDRTRVTKGARRRTIDGCGCKWKCKAQMNNVGEFCLWTFDPLDKHTCNVVSASEKESSAVELWNLMNTKSCGVFDQPVKESDDTLTWETILKVNLVQGLGDNQILKRLNLWRIKTKQTQLKPFTLQQVQHKTRPYRDKVKLEAKFDATDLIQELKDDHETYVNTFY